MEPAESEMQYTQESLAALPSAELVKIILEQQATLKSKEQASSQRKRKLDEISSPAGEQPEAAAGGPANKKRKTKQDRPFDWNRYSKRHIALKFSYLGWDYLGLVTQKNASPTVEEKLFEALMKTKLIESPQSCEYSRCGRTDKGVSAFSQVCSLTVRSNVSSGVGLVSVGTDMKDAGKEEIDYVTMLNHHLPADIRVMGWCPVPVDFDARFSCKWRLYRYYFVRENLNIDAMRAAGAHLIGEHDFRNFCKMDAQNVHNYTRTLLSFDIEPQEDGRDPADPKKMFAFVIKGYAFLWHQVRCMTSILFLVGQGKEKPEIIRDMLDLNKMPRKPVYPIASEIPLVLYDSGYDEAVVQWRNTAEVQQGIWRHFLKSWTERQIRTTIVQSMLRSISMETVSMDNGAQLRVWDEIKDSVPDKRARYENYTLVTERDTETTYEEKIENIMGRLERTGKTQELERLRGILAAKQSGQPVAADEDFGE